MPEPAPTASDLQAVTHQQNTVQEVAGSLLQALLQEAAGLCWHVLSAQATEALPVLAAAGQLPAWKKCAGTQLWLQRWRQLQLVLHCCC
jgi:hypothetical protein